MKALIVFALLISSSSTFADQSYDPHEGQSPQRIIPEPEIPLDATDEELEKAFRPGCDKGSKNAQWGDHRRDLYFQEKDCIDAKVDAWKKANSREPSSQHKKKLGKKPSK